MKNRKWDIETKMAVILEMLKQEQSVSQICKAHGVSEALAYKWREEALLAMQERLSGKQAHGNGTHQAERDRLLRVIGQQAYAIECQKKYLSQYAT